MKKSPNRRRGLKEAPEESLEDILKKIGELIPALNVGRREIAGKTITVTTTPTDRKEGEHKILVRISSGNQSIVVDAFLDIDSREVTITEISYEDPQAPETKDQQHKLYVEDRTYQVNAPLTLS